MGDRRIILASASPRRQAFLRSLGLEFVVQSADIDETPQDSELPIPLAIRLAETKARAVADALRDAGADALVIAADTVVARDNQLLGKPTDAAEARAMLATLRGRSHFVYTAVSVIDVTSGRQLTRVSDSEVEMSVYSNEEIDAYIATGDPFDKAGGYAIQNSTFAPVEGYTGSYTGIMGLPLEELEPLLADFGVYMDADRLTQVMKEAVVIGKPKDRKQ